MSNAATTPTLLTLSSLLSLLLSLTSRLLTSLSQDRSKCCVTKCTRKREKRTLLAFSTCEIRFLIVARVAQESVLPLSPSRSLSLSLIELLKIQKMSCTFAYSSCFVPPFVTWQTTTILTLYQQFWMLNCCHAPPPPPSSSTIEACWVHRQLSYELCVNMCRRV